MGEIALYNIAAVAIIFILSYYSAPILYRKKRNRVFFSIGLSFLLVIIVSFYSEYVPVNFSNQTAIIKLVDPIKSLLFYSREDNTDIKSFIRDNFQLINVDPFWTQDSIIQMLSLIAKEKPDIDLVIFDAHFYETPGRTKEIVNKDSLLCIYFMNMGDKLIVEYNSDKYDDGIYGCLSKNKKGQTSYHDFEDKYFEEQLFDNQKNSNLPYKAYGKLCGCTVESKLPHLYLEKDNQLEEHYILGQFIPKLYSETEDILSIMKSDPNNTHIGWYKTFSDLQKNLHDNIIYSKSKNKKNILFVGSFNGFNDIHSTPYGDFHGATILINVMYNLKMGRHQNAIPYLITLFISLSLIGYITINSSFRNKLPKKIARNNIIKVFYAVIIKGESHYWALLGVYLGIYIYFDKIVNVLSLFIVFVLIEKVFKNYKESFILNENKTP